MFSKASQRVFILLAVSMCAALLSRNALSCPACPMPGSVSTDPYDDLSNSSYVWEYFEMTLYNFSIDPENHEVQELPGTYEGTNGCWFPGSDIPYNPPNISGGAWWVGSDDRYGPDEIGLVDKDAEQIWGAYTGGQVILPCEVVTYQDMEIECDVNVFYDYETNVPLTRTEDSTHALVVCRSSECGKEIPIY